MPPKPAHRIYDIIECTNFAVQDSECLPMIELVNVTQHYGIRPVLKRVNLRIEKGELVVVVGPTEWGRPRSWA